jgi:hypothetical protein
MQFDARLKSYSIRNRLTKGMLMELAYGKNCSGIDSALPQGYVDAQGLSYGAEDPRKDLFFYCVNYNEARAFGKIEYIPDVLEAAGYAL